MSPSRFNPPGRPGIPRARDHRPPPGTEKRSSGSSTRPSSSVNSSATAVMANANTLLFTGELEILHGDTRLQNTIGICLPAGGSSSVQRWLRPEAASSIAGEATATDPDAPGSLLFQPSLQRLCIACRIPAHSHRRDRTAVCSGARFRSTARTLGSPRPRCGREFGEPRARRRPGPRKVHKRAGRSGAAF